MRSANADASSIWSLNANRARLPTQPRSYSAQAKHVDWPKSQLRTRKFGPTASSVSLTTQSALSELESRSIGRFCSDCASRRTIVLSWSPRSWVQYCLVPRLSSITNLQTGNMALFDNALSEMAGSSFLEPQPFLSYARQAGFSDAKPAYYISIQNLRGLSPELRAAGVMVFRLGCASGRKETNFALARHAGSWNDYFLQDQTIFAGCPQFSVPGCFEDLRIFEILPKSTETSLVNLAVASGVLRSALGLDAKDDAIVNATAQGTYTFTVRPQRDLAACWYHVSGQVEIDGAFIAFRGGVETLFVIEAKVSKDFDSLAKHKIAYPMLALQTELKGALPTIGVYLRVIRRRSGFDFCVAECVFSSPNQEIASLTPVRAVRYRLEREKSPNRAY